MVVLEADFYGGARSVELAGAEVAQAWPRRNRCIIAVTSGASAVVRLPDARLIPWPGFPAFYVFNDGDSSDSLLLHDRGGTLLATMPVGYMVTVSLEARDDQDGSWGVSQPREFAASLGIA